MSRTGVFPKDGAFIEAVSSATSILGSNLRNVTADTMSRIMVVYLDESSHAEYRRSGVFPKDGAFIETVSSATFVMSLPYVTERLSRLEEYRSWVRKAQPRDAKVLCMRISGSRRVFVVCEWR